MMDSEPHIQTPGPHPSPASEGRESYATWQAAFENPSLSTGKDLGRGHNQPPILLLACGALARDVIALRDRQAWPADVQCVPALLHNTPGKIAPAVERRILALRDRYRHIVVVYGDCGTSGALDAALDRLGVERISGPHCFEQIGGALHDSILADTPGTFFLTDFLVRHFEALVWRNLGLDRFPELIADYFGHYQQIIYLAQTDNPDLRDRAVRAAQRIGLPLTVQLHGYGDLETRLQSVLHRLCMDCAENVENFENAPIMKRKP